MNAFSVSCAHALCGAGSASAQASSALHLSDYVGTYTDAPGHTLEIVAGDELFAVLDEAKYPLRASAVRTSSPPSPVKRFPSSATHTAT